MGEPIYRRMGYEERHRREFRLASPAHRSPSRAGDGCVDSAASQLRSGSRSVAGVTSITVQPRARRRLRRAASRWRRAVPLCHWSLSYSMAMLASGYVRSGVRPPDLPDVGCWRTGRPSPAPLATCAVATSHPLSVRPRSCARAGAQMAHSAPRAQQRVASPPSELADREEPRRSADSIAISQRVDVDHRGQVDRGPQRRRHRDRPHASDVRRQEVESCGAP